MVRTIINNNNSTTRRISIRKALRYSGCSKNICYRNKIHRYAIANAVTSYCRNTINNKNDRKRDTKNLPTKTNLWYPKNGSNADKSIRNTHQQKEGTKNLQKDGLHYAI
ncbi:MAG: hypothetical protein MRJ93_00270 [Nitrososphaeraceae archaeon]|nr:hypothetical protein [Nitrososphaeraceae archaeon]